MRYTTPIKAAIPPKAAMLTPTAWPAVRLVDALDEEVAAAADEVDIVNEQDDCVLVAPSVLVAAAAVIGDEDDASVCKLVEVATGELVDVTVVVVSPPPARLDVVASTVSVLCVADTALL
jgi:hypothetical protein